MHGISFFNRYRKHNTSKCSGDTTFCIHHMRIAFGPSYRIRWWNVLMEHRSDYHFYFSEQRKYLYSNSYRS